MRACSVRAAHRSAPLVLRAVVYRESVSIGQTDLTPVEVQQLVSRMGAEYKGNRYHLLQRNCR